MNHQIPVKTQYPLVLEIIISLGREMHVQSLQNENIVVDAGIVLEGKKKRKIQTQCRNIADVTMSLHLMNGLVDE